MCILYIPGKPQEISSGSQIPLEPFAQSFNRFKEAQEESEGFKGIWHLTLLNADVICNWYSVRI